MPNYSVSVTCDFQAETREEAVDFMVGWLADNMQYAEYFVEDEYGISSDGIIPSHAPPARPNGYSISSPSDAWQVVTSTTYSSPLGEWLEIDPAVERIIADEEWTAACSTMSIEEATQAIRRNLRRAFVPEGGRRFPDVPDDPDDR